MKVTNYNNDYLIIDFSQAIEYHTYPISELISISISGPDAPYNFTWEIPYWQREQF